MTGPAGTTGPAGMTGPAGTTGPAADGGRRRRGGRGERPMVPEAEFVSYYGRPVVRPSPWTPDIPGYFFLGGLAAGSSLLAAGADLTGRPALRRATRLTALGGLVGSFGLLVHDLGRPSRFHHMLRVAKARSPMSVGTWILTAYAPFAGLAALSEGRSLLPTRLRAGGVGRRLPTAGRAAGLVAAGIAPALASYTAVLLTDTATPTWHEARSQLPFVFVGSAAAAGGGGALLFTPAEQAAPARRLAIAGAALDLAAGQAMEGKLGVLAEPLRSGRAHGYQTAAKVLTAAGALLAALGRRRRDVSAAAGVALLAGSVCNRFGIFHAGQQSARDPKYTVVPQRERLARRGSAAVPGR